MGAANGVGRIGWRVSTFCLRNSIAACIARRGVVYILEELLLWGAGNGQTGLRGGGRRSSCVVYLSRLFLLS